MDYWLADPCAHDWPKSRQDYFHGKNYRASDNPHRISRVVGRLAASGRPSGDVACGLTGRVNSSNDMLVRNVDGVEAPTL